MSDQSIPEEKSENRNSKSENVNEHFPEDSHAPQTSNLELQTTGMEVHHHPKVEKKNFKEYFLEFLMIFLAVSMGFIAKNIREHISENKKAEELAKSLYKELFADSVTVRQGISFRLNKEKECDYFIDYVRDSNLTNLSQRFYLAFARAFFITSYFEPKDGILNQVIYSGSLRYFKNIQLQTKIGELSVAIASVRLGNGREFNYFDDPIKHFLLEHFDYRWFDEYIHNGQTPSADLMSIANPFPPKSPVIINLV